MFKRLFWFSSGAASGVAGSMWLRRRIQERLRRFTPAGVRDQALRKAKQARVDAQTALTEARELARLSREHSDDGVDRQQHQSVHNGRSVSTRR